MSIWRKSSHSDGHGNNCVVVTVLELESTP
jgi:hypothetical protein